MLARAEAAAALDGPEGRAALAGAAERAAAALAPHLERLALLDGVPLRHLVPHPEMLPPESLCPFRTDPAWIDALLAGAASSGGTCPGPEARIDDALRTAAVRAARPHRPEAGLLIRSRLVEAGPELPVAASTGEDRAPSGSCAATASPPTCCWSCSTRSPRRSRSAAPAAAPGSGWAAATRSRCASWPPDPASATPARTGPPSRTATTPPRAPY
ncbi:hypothetical protein ACFQXA_02625 [Nocardiopsis composta]